MKQAIFPYEKKSSFNPIVSFSFFQNICKPNIFMDSAQA